MVSLAAIAPMLNQSIYSPVIDQLQEDLGASDVQLSLTLSLYILWVAYLPNIM
jgi:ABC-type antimicrobial peptide transport system permease subunit